MKCHDEEPCGGGALAFVTMPSLSGTMFARVTRRVTRRAALSGLAFGLIASSQAAFAQHMPTIRQPPRQERVERIAPSGVTADDLRRHITVLAGDAFQGREPNTEGERLTTDYIIRELTARGVQPAGPNGSWLQPVPIVERTVAGDARTRWHAGNRAIRVPDTGFLLAGRDATAHVENARVVFAGHGAVMPDRGIDQLSGADVRGAVVLIMAEGPEVEGFPALSERIRAVTDAGAVGVIAITSPGAPFDQMRSMRGTRTTALDLRWPEVFGVVSFEVASTLVRGAGRDLTRLIDEQPGSSFRSLVLPLTATIDVTTPVRRFTSNNVVGRIRGSAVPTLPVGTQSVLLMGHWDHLGLCRPEGEADRICNGAVDNASGIATLIEAAGHLARGPRPVRDILILATTAEEMGLIGAEQFAETPVVPLGSIVAAVNVDTAAIAPAGTPVAVIGSAPRLETVVARVAVGLGRELDRDREADVMEQRQDGWALARRGVPAIMAGGSFSNMTLLGAFLSGPYHAPNDELRADTPLAGAAEDTDLLIAIARAFADPAQLIPPPRD